MAKEGTINDNVNGNTTASMSRNEGLLLELLLANLGKGMYGLELVNRSGGKIKRGTVYVTLSRMEHKGYVQSKVEEPRPGSIGLPRRLYEPTGYGRRVFEAWQTLRRQLQWAKGEAQL